MAGHCQLRLAMAGYGWLLLAIAAYGWLWLAGLVAGAFALRTLQLIDATALWSDELYSVGKSFQPSYADLLAQLRRI